MIITFILAFLIGVFSVLLLEAFLLYKWWTSKEEDVRKPHPQRTRVTNPEFIADYFKKDSATERESCMSLNLLLAFLWKEWRDSPQMRAFFLKKMNFEFSELMQGRTASKLIEQITIEEFSLGSSLPVIKGATVMKIGAKDPKDVPQELDIAVDVEYSGGCHMAIQVDLLFNKSVYLAIKLVSLRGRARLQLSRHPLTHWSLAFYEEPEVEFEAESQFEGKNLPQLTTLIINHLRKSIQKKHTLPSYKIRYQPFFRELLPQDETQEAYVHDSLVTIGTLRVSVIGCSRLPEIENSVSQYCSLSVDLLPWSQLAENRRAMWPTFDIEINRENTDSFGLTLSKDISEDDLGKTIVIDTIVVDSPAFKAGVVAKDHLVAVDGQKIDSLKQAAKMIKSKARFTATVQRPPSRITKETDKENTDNEGVKKTLVNFKNVTLSNESDSEDEFVNIVVPLLEPHADNESDKSVVREILSKSTEFKQKADKRLRGKQVKRINPGPMAMENSAVTKISVDQPCRDQKSSGKDMKLEFAPRSNMEQLTVEIDKKCSPQHGNIPQPQGTNQRRVSVSSFTALDGLDNKKTKEVPARSDPDWNETVHFDIIKRDQYLNVCVWSKLQEKNTKNILVGYVTIPLMEIALQCLLVGSKIHEECFVLVSPHSGRVISSYPYLRNHPGLRERLCCGDITLSFQHTPSLADCDESVLQKMVSLENLTPQDESKDPLESLEPPKHQFILTQFYFPTRCRYCGKKVWTKVAYQCRICGMICHKKCLRSCIGYTQCIHSKPSSSTWFAEKPSKPSVDDTLDDEVGKGVENEQTQVDETLEFREAAVDSSGSLERDHTREEKVTLTDEAVDSTMEKSTECTSKEHKGETEVESDETERQGISSDIEIASERIREAGRELFTNLPLEIRKNKLLDMMNKLQVEIDEENETRTDLYQERAKARDGKQRSFIDSLLVKSEERSQALAMLMLQYCAGLQSCAETEELETCRL